jgi:hypothetical protein
VAAPKNSVRDLAVLVVLEERGVPVFIRNLDGEGGFGLRGAVRLFVILKRYNLKLPKQKRALAGVAAGHGRDRSPYWR